jgi:hypothetical protein
MWLQQNQLLLSQNEHTRIVRKLDRLEASARGPFKRSRVEVLQEEYGRGLEVGGVQGGSICCGVLSAADELGIDTNSVVDRYRNQRHRDNLERAQHNVRLADLFSKQGPPEPPFPRPGTSGSGEASGPRRIGTPRQSSTKLLAKDGTPLTKTRRRSWK